MIYQYQHGTAKFPFYHLWIFHPGIGSNCNFSSVGICFSILSFSDWSIFHPSYFFSFFLWEMCMYAHSRISCCSIKQFWDVAHLMNINQGLSHANLSNLVKGIVNELFSKMDVKINLGAHTASFLDSFKPSIHNTYTKYCHVNPIDLLFNLYYFLVWACPSSDNCANQQVRTYCNNFQTPLFVVSSSQPYLDLHLVQIPVSVNDF